MKYHCTKELVFITFGANFIIWLLFGVFQSLDVHPKRAEIPRIAPSLEADIRSKIEFKLYEMLQDIKLLQSKSRHVSAFPMASSIVSKLENVLQILKIKPGKQLVETAESISVCPETYTVGKGYRITNCVNSDLLNKVVSILLNFVHVSKKKQKDILSGIEEYHENLNVIVAVREFQKNQFYSRFKLTIHQQKMSSKTNDGYLWNKLVSSARTPFILIGRDLDLFTVDVRLERLVREIELLNVPIVGGATRTPDGHWRMGCNQLAYKNFTLVHKSGYDKSKHECVFCDHISGPFMSRTDYLRKHPFNETLEDTILFHDLMLQMHSKNQPVVVCPDAMFHLTKHESDIEILREKWIPFAQKWKLNRLRLSSRTLHEFTEKESLTECSRNVGKISAPLCLQYLVDGIKLIMKTCEEHTIICELRAGTVLGTLKFGSVIPWERDGDICFHYKDNNYSAFKDAVKIMRLRDHNIKEREYDSMYPLGIFDYFVTGWRLEVYAEANIDSIDLLQKGILPTKTLLDGQWVNVPRNPGLYARNEFGYEMYRHQEHLPTYLGPQYFYHPSNFYACSSPKGHDCLDQYPLDGNLQFGEPEP